MAGDYTSRVKDRLDVVITFFIAGDLSRRR